MGKIKRKIIEAEEQSNITPEDYPYMSEQELHDVLAAEEGPLST